MLCTKKGVLLREGMPCTHISAGLPPMTWPQETGCKPHMVQKQFPPTVVLQESQDWQWYFSCGNTFTIFSVPDNILSSRFALFRDFFFFFFNIERSNSVRCNCSCSNPMLMLLFKEGLVRAVLLLLSIFSFIHACRLIIHSCNKAILEQMMLSGHSFNPTRSCEYVIPWHVLVNLATRELDPRSSYSLDKPRGCSHTLCCLSKSKSQNF